MTFTKTKFAVNYVQIFIQILSNHVFSSVSTVRAQLTWHSGFSHRDARRMPVKDECAVHARM